MLFENGRLDAALVSYREASRFAPTSALIRRELGRVAVEVATPDLAGRGPPPPDRGDADRSGGCRGMASARYRARSCGPVRPGGSGVRRGGRPDRRHPPGEGACGTRAGQVARGIRPSAAGRGPACADGPRNGKARTARGDPDPVRSLRRPPVCRPRSRGGRVSPHCARRAREPACGSPRASPESRGITLCIGSAPNSSSGRLTITPRALAWGSPLSWAAE